VRLRGAVAAIVAGLLLLGTGACSPPVVDWPPPHIPASEPPGSPAAALIDSCWFGTWLSTSEVDHVLFYPTVDPIPFTSKGAVRTLRPDGVAEERMDGVTLTATYQGHSLRVVIDGTAEFRWWATATTFTYGDFISNNLTFTHYEDGRVIDEHKDQIGARSITISASCTRTRTTEHDDTIGHQAVWKRVSTA
jgi:hypothetical protein